jgi:hypothetical protein
VVNELDASCIAILQDIFKDSNVLKVLETDLAYIHANFSFLSQSITKLEKTINLSETIKEINDIQEKLNKINGSKVDALKQKFRSCFSKNRRFKVMCEISCVLEGEDLVESEDLKVLSVVTSCVTSMQDWYRVMWNVHFLNTNHFRHNRHRFQLKDDFRGSLQQCFTFCLRY